MSNRTLAALSAVALLSTACVKEISSDERLERDTRKSDSFRSSTAEDLLKLKCEDITSELTKSRDDSAPEDKRLTVYADLFDRVRDRTAKFDEAITRNPDLAYQEGSQELMAARDGCTQASADVRLDYEGLVREIINLPVVDEMRDGKQVKAARISFETLRNAIEQLNLDDKDQLLTRLSNAEKSIDVKANARKRER